MKNTNWYLESKDCINWYIILIVGHYALIYKTSLSPHIIIYIYISSMQNLWLWLLEYIRRDNELQFFFSSFFFFCTILWILDHGDLLGKLLGKAHGSLSDIGMEVAICDLFAPDRHNRTHLGYYKDFRNANWRLKNCAIKGNW